MMYVHSMRKVVVRLRDHTDDNYVRDIIRRLDGNTAGLIKYQKSRASTFGESVLTLDLIMTVRLPTAHVAYHVVNDHLVILMHVEI